MGMNIYTIKDRIHIGKRWAAGVWCWDCKIEAEKDIAGAFFFCPNCAKRCEMRTLAFNPAMRELGFDKNAPKKHIGVDGASGFIWQVGNCGLGNTIEEIKKALKKRKFVYTEYGEKWSIQQFWEMFNDVIEETERNDDFS